MKKTRIYFWTILFFLVLYIFSYHYTLSAKTIKVNNNNEKEVYPVGRLIGLKLYTDGVLVVGMSEVEDEQGKMYAPYENSDIKEGDLIKSVNGIESKDVNHFIEQLNESRGSEISILYQRDNEEMRTKIKPIKSKNGDYMVGLWVRDAAAGIGTLTYFDEKESKFAALGHGIDDVDTGKLLNISNGEILTAKLVSIVKGKSNKPGEIRGTLDEGINIGAVERNTDLGVFGYVDNKDYIDLLKLKKIPVENRNNIQIGSAKLMCQVSENNVEEYDVEIKKVYRNNFSNNKSMLIKIIDKNLIEKTGGIIPGMSGAPIIQNDKLIGAITNVMLKDPTQGYAIFADMMF